MEFLKKNIWTLGCMAVVMLLVLAGDASAQTSGSTLMQTAQDKTRNVFASVKTVMFILGGFGLVAVAWFAVFGTVKWKWFAGLAVGLAILAAAGAIVEYATGSGEANLATTFGQK